MAKPKNDARPDVGPDPNWGLAVFVVGLLVMAVGGAGNWHWTFNVGMGTLLLGVVLFSAFVAITAVKQEPDRYMGPARKVWSVIWHSSFIARLFGRRPD